MSLKAFHVFFVVVALIFCGGFGIWAVRVYMELGDLGHLVMGGVSLIACVVLLVYFRWFLRKLKNESYL